MLDIITPNALVAIISMVLILALFVGSSYLFDYLTAYDNWNIRKDSVINRANRERNIALFRMAR